MTLRILLFAGLLLAPYAVVAQPAPVSPTRQAPPRPPAPPAAPAPGAVPARERAVPAPPPPPPPPEPAIAVIPESRGQIAIRRAGQPVNIKVDVTFHDQTANEPRRTKTVSVMTADGLTGYVRTTAVYEGNVGRTPLNIDVEPRIIAGGKVRLLLNLQYTLVAFSAERAAANSAVPRTTEIAENLSLVLEDGKPMVVSQSADPVGDRRVTVEVVAAIGK